MGCRKCLKRLVACISPCLRLAPTVPAGSRVARKYDPLLLRGNVRLAPIMCVLDASYTIRCVLWTACSEYKLNPKSGTYATLINVILWSVFPWKMTSMFPMYSTLISPTVPDRDCFATGRRGPHIVHSCPIMRHVARRTAVGNPNIVLIAVRLHYKGTV